MVSYFVPISLLVLAGFALGLLVGRLAWRTPKLSSGRELQTSGSATTAHEPDDPEKADLSTEAEESGKLVETSEHEEWSERHESDEVASADSMLGDHEPTLDLPVWQIKEVRSRQRQGSTSSPEELAVDNGRAADPDVDVDPETESEIAFDSNPTTG